MRTLIDIRSTFEPNAIMEVDLDRRSRDDIPRTLLRMQFIYGSKPLRREVFGLLEKHLYGKLAARPRWIAGKDSVTHPANRNPGMQIWTILVLGLLKHATQCDYYRLEELADQHRAIYQMLGVKSRYYYKGPRLTHRTIRRNLQLLTPDLLRTVIDMVTDAGYKLPGYRRIVR